MITQHYKLKATQDNIDNALAGQVVFAHNDSNEVAGFVDFITDEELGIMLFDPTDIPDSLGAVNISANVDWTARLNEIMENDSDMKEFWIELLKKSE